MIRPSYAGAMITGSDMKEKREYRFSCSMCRPFDLPWRSSPVEAVKEYVSHLDKVHPYALGQIAVLKVKLP